MRKAAYIINIIDAVLSGIGALLVLLIGCMWNALSGEILQQLIANDPTVAPEVYQGILNVYGGSIWFAFVICLVGVGIQILAAVLNKKASSKGQIIAPAILSIVVGGILGIVAGIFLLVAEPSEYEQPLFI